MEIDYRSCEYFFLPVNPSCILPSTTTTSSTSSTSTTTSTTSTTTSTTSTTTTEFCECYEGYTPNVDGTICVKTERTDADPPSDQQLSVEKTYSQYSVYGSILFDLGYNLDGTTSAGYQILSTALWKNIPYNTTEGPLNRCGLWAATVRNNQDVGFTKCITVETTKTYYIAVGCDNYAIIRVDGRTIIHQDVLALYTQFGASTSVTFKYWFIYPVELTAGIHVIEMIGHNNENIAALGAEIYDASAADIIAATDYATFYSEHILFSTRDMRGEYIQIGSDGFGWTCPDGFSLITCDGDPYCINMSYLDCGETPTTTTTTTTMIPVPSTTTTSTLPR